MTTSDAAMRSPGVSTTPSMKVTVTLNFFTISNPLRFAEIEKPLPIRLPHLEGSGEDEWRKAWMRGRVVKRLCGTAIGYKDFTQAEWVFSISRANADAGHRLTEAARSPR